MPVTNLVRIMRKVLPPQAKVAEQAKETMQVCVSEFIGFITSEANERCQKEHRRIVTAEDILWAMDTLGFDNYVGPLVSFLKRYRQSEVPNLGGRGRVPLPQVVGTYPIISSSSSPSPSPSPSLLSPQYMMACYGPNFPPSQNWCQGMFDSSGMCEFYDDASGGSGNVVSDFDPLNIHKRA
ncbi:nuclear transcription factor Y subunit B-9 [Cajanus cajan]|uniref:Nuclear transcription factor Y subunit B-9 n=1 Tax=Cajanus cajan TaxID=3821 RepID=A0A151R545_CAJCA|nr:nuclear transcription factor Y subunit B-9 [Cajanus cajan]KYP37643.1 Nuclear transcription factor Y subunit B-9 [Cajanus cajan]